MSSPIRVLALVIVLWLIGIACLGSLAVIGGILAVPGVCTLWLCVHLARRAKWGDVEAWLSLSLAPLGFLGVLALSSIHLHEFIGRGSTCDAMAQDCDPQPLQGLAHTASLVAFAAAAVLTVRLIRIVRRTHAGTEAGS